MNHHVTFTTLNTTCMPRNLVKAHADFAPVKPRKIKRAVKLRPTPQVGAKPRFIVIDTPPRPKHKRLRFALISPLAAMIGMITVGTTLITATMSYAGLL